MSLVKKVSMGFIVLLGFFIASASVQKKEKNLRQNIKEMEEKIPEEEETLSQPIILPIDEVEGKIIEDWLKKGTIYNLVVSIEENTSQEIPLIGEITGKNLIVKVDVPEGIENEVLRWVEGMRNQYPMVLVEGVKITGEERKSTMEVSMIVYGS